MNLGQILQKTTTDRYGERDTRYKALLEEMEHSREVTEKPRGMPFILRSVPRGSKVLEFGPASGYMTRYLKEVLECEVTIVELDPDCAASASVYADRCFIGNVDGSEWDEWLESEKFDIITFCDVLEHLREPWHALKRAVRHLREEGSVLCSIPNTAHHTVIAHLLENEFEYFSCGLLDITHVRFFTSRSLNELFEYCGLGVAAEGNTILLEVVEGAEWPWISGAKIPALLAFQKNLSKRAPYQVFQYVVELKSASWMKSHGTTELDLYREESLADEADFPGGEMLQAMAQKQEKLLLQNEELRHSREELLHEKEELLRSSEELICEKEGLKNRLDITMKELETRTDYLEGVLSSQGAKIWNSCVKLVSLFLILPVWRRKIRKKYSIK